MNDTPPTLNVQMGQVKIAHGNERLRAILGSCVGIGLIWKERNICGLAHCLLPKSPKQTFEIGAKFVDQATRSLVALMKIQPDDAHQVEAVVAGGGNMIVPTKSTSSIGVGESNYHFALDELERLGVKIVHFEGGDEMGRRLTIDANEMSFEIDVIPRISELA